MGWIENLNCNNAKQSDRIRWYVGRKDMFNSRIFVNNKDIRYVCVLLPPFFAVNLKITDLSDVAGGHFRDEREKQNPSIKLVILWS